MATIGKLNVITKELNIEWRIHNFLSLQKKGNKYYSSPIFHFAKASWCLNIFPNGCKENDAAGFISIYVSRTSAGPPISLECSIQVKTFDGKKCEEKPATLVFTNKMYCIGYPHFLSRPELLEKQSELLPSNVLTVILSCTLSDTQSSKDENYVETAGPSDDQKQLNAENISSQEKKCTEKPLICPEDSDDVSSEDWFDPECSTSIKGDGNETTACSQSKESLDTKKTSSHEKACTDKQITCPKCTNLFILEEHYERQYQMTRTESISTEDNKSVTRDYKKVLLDGRHHDLTLKIGDRTLRAHKDILRARSRVFESMLDHDMKEKNSGIIDVPDCDPQAMELFLSYLYCGKIEGLDQNTMLGLYYIADKYDMQSLKSDCCEFIKKSLLATNICDVILLALKHSDSGLLEYVTDYFMENVLDIIVTVEWQSFLTNNSTLGNELMIKSFRKVKHVTK